MKPTPKAIEACTNASAAPTTVSTTDPAANPSAIPTRDATQPAKPYPRGLKNASVGFGGASTTGYPLTAQAVQYEGS